MIFTFDYNNEYQYILILLLIFQEISGMKVYKNKKNIKKCFRMIFPASDEEMLEMRQQGYEDALRCLYKKNIISENTYNKYSSYKMETECHLRNREPTFQYLSHRFNEKSSFSSSWRPFIIFMASFIVMFTLICLVYK